MSTSERSTAPGPAGAAVVLALVAVIAPTGAAIAAGRSWLPVALCCTVATVVVATLRSGGAVPVLAVAAATGAVAAVAAGWPIGIWAGVGLLWAQWTCSGPPPLPTMGRPGPGAAPMVAGLSGAALLGVLTGRSPVLTALALSGAVAAPWLTRWRDGALERGVARVGAAIAHGVSAVVFVVLGVLVVVLPWVAQRLVRWDPLRPRRLWTPTDRSPARSTAPWRADRALVAHSGRRTAGTVAVLSLAVVALALVSPLGRGVVQRLGGDTDERQPFTLGGSPPAGQPPADDELRAVEARYPVDDAVSAYQPSGNIPGAAMQDSEWFTTGELYNTAQGWALHPDAAWRPVNPYRLLDFRSALLNVVDGDRLSWSPPSCDCRRLTVWIYGGSTTYGLNQRDEHTIASELARTAWEHGIALDVHNRGANGHVHWMEAERFAWDLTMDEPPDLVVFYDGANEMWSGGTLNYLEIPDGKPMFDPTLVDLWDDTGRSDPPVPDGPEGASFEPLRQEQPFNSPELERILVDRYDRSREVSRTAADAHDVPVRYVWQPTRYTRPLVMAEPHADGQTENASRRSHALVSHFLPDDVIDLSDALSDTDAPLFTDDVHHNELAARLVAEALYGQLEPDLRRWSGSS